MPGVIRHRVTCCFRQHKFQPVGDFCHQNPLGFAPSPNVFAVAMPMLIDGPTRKHCFLVLILKKYRR